jgi:NNP family nitrate/nitrite transporter-like MFS transporter
MALGAAGVLAASARHSLPGFIACFVWLFALSGVGNGSVYKLIPGIFADKVADPKRAQALGGALIAIAGAVGAFGGVLVNLAFRESFLSYHSGTGAYVAFIVAYAVCGTVTRLVYQRREVAAPVSEPEPAPASV